MKSRKGTDHASPPSASLGRSVAVAVLSAAVVAMRPADSSLHVFRVNLGLQDKEPTDWSGQVAVSGGEVAELTGWRSSPRM